MTKADQNRARAADLFARAKTETDPMMRAEWQHLARSYLHLAEQEERKDRSEEPEVPYEVPQQRPNAGQPQQHQQQQQQQPQPEPGKK